MIREQICRDVEGIGDDSEPFAVFQKTGKFGDRGSPGHSNHACTLKERKRALRDSAFFVEILGRLVIEWEIVKRGVRRCSAVRAADQPLLFEEFEVPADCRFRNGKSLGEGADPDAARFNDRRDDEIESLFSSHEATLARCA